MNDRELLALAAKAVGIKLRWWDNSRNGFRVCNDTGSVCKRLHWNPIADDRDALRLANKLSIDILHNWESVTAQWELGKFCREKCTDETRDEATRSAITRAAAEIGKAMP